MSVLDIYGLVANSVTDGPGLRFAVFCQGCRHNCPGCHNPDSHPFGVGDKYRVEEIYDMIKKDPLVRGVTFSGGEPFSQREAFADLARMLKEDGYEVAAYSGYTFEQLIKGDIPGRQRLLGCLDVLIDGPFILEQRSLSAGFKGSLNQRILNVPRSLKEGKAVLETSPRWNVGEING